MGWIPCRKAEGFDPFAIFKVKGRWISCQNVAFLTTNKIHEKNKRKGEEREEAERGRKL
jgi:hypothetical protein